MKYFSKDTCFKILLDFGDAEYKPSMLWLISNKRLLQR